MSVTTREKIAYGSGDMACNFVWQTVMLFLAYFYTDVYGLSPLHMGTMFLVVRILDAVTDPLMGNFVDRRNFAKGKYRPYLLWIAIPYAIACVLAFYTPSFSAMGKLVYAYATYILLTLTYTAINVPYCALANAITDDSAERTSLQSYRFAMTNIAGLVVTLSALPLVSLLGAGDEQKGYLLTMVIMALLSIALFVYSYNNVTERVEMKAGDASSNSLPETMRRMWNNLPWRILFFMNLFQLIAIVVKGSSTMYYVNSVMQRPELATKILVITMLANIAGAIAASKLFGQRDKAQTYISLLVASGLLSIALYFVPASSVMTVVGLVVVYSFLFMAAGALSWSMMTDVVDYERATTGENRGGIIFASFLFAIKFGVALGGATVGWLLAASGYVGGAEQQTAAAVNFITLMYTVIPGVAILAIALLMKQYPLTKQRMAEIKGKLAFN